MRLDITFPSEGAECAGWLYVPDDLEGRAPAIVMTNAITAVKEITLPGYAERFVAAGYVVLAFDYRCYGASGGSPRNHIDPDAQRLDIRNAITWLRARPEVDPHHVGMWGVSIGGSHALHLGAYDRRLKAVVAVATGLNVMEQVVGAPTVQTMLRLAAGEWERLATPGAEPAYMPAVGHEGTQALMPFEEAYDFYTEAAATVAPAYENRVTFASMANLLADHSDVAMHLISPTALLMIHGDNDMIPAAAARAVFDRAVEPKSFVTFPCGHTDLYVREPWVTQSAETAIAWFDRYLHNPRRKPTVAWDIERNKAIVRRLYDESHKGNLDAYDELLAPAFVSYSTAAGMEVRGIEAFKAAWQMFATAFTGFSSTIDMIIAEDDLVMVYGTATGRHDGPIFGIAPTGRDLSWTGISVYRFNADGLIDGRWQEIDAVALFTQLGVMPPMGPGGA